MPPPRIEPYLADCRDLVVEEIRRITPPDGPWTGGLYALVLDYPLRGAKALRPALCIATARMLGAPLDAALPTAAALELYHNAFLVHDDVEDGSELRRGKPSLPSVHGVPVSVNVGDAMLALAMRPLLENTRLIGVRRSLAILDVLTRMAQRSAEGQAMELGWVRNGSWAVAPRDYLHMVYLKTAWYSFVAPMACGLIVADGSRLEVQLRRLATMLGIAFQIQDDVLNLMEAGVEADVDSERYGKEVAGDLWEGKRTLMLIHALACAPAAEAAEARRILDVPRSEKVKAEVAWLLAFVRRHGGIEEARRSALQHARRAARIYAQITPELPPSIHRDFLGDLIGYVTERSW
ncbi:geranylgeranyl diphosphate synthetase [Deltaproteobacteria bacterium]|nr:geranylgeranyl diphosphate synthetase [Deltaproteobacteria bacterium]